VTYTQAEVDAGLGRLEAYWRLYVDELGFPAPYADASTKYKIDVHVVSADPGTWVAAGGLDPSGHPALWVSTIAFDGDALAHEVVHALQGGSGGMRDSAHVGWIWESHAEWMTSLYTNKVGCSEMLVNMPHIYYGSTRNRYCNWQFWEYLKDVYGVHVVNDIWRLSRRPNDPARMTEDPFTALMRNQGWSLAQLNDEFGNWAMRNVTWDYKQRSDLFRESYGPYSDTSGERFRRVTRLNPHPSRADRWVVPSYWAPQRWGYNLVRLYPQKPQTDATAVVTFQGVTQKAAAAALPLNFANQPSAVPPPASGWRWGLVAVDEAGRPRYSALQRATRGTLSFDVKAGDQELWLVVVGAPERHHQIIWDQVYYSIYRFPWMVQLEGVIPEGGQTTSVRPDGQLHANGGGWVSSNATVSPSAYVGPHAEVRGGLVEEQARIEDDAVVLAGRVRGSARVGALTLVRGGTAEIRDQAEVYAVINALDDFTIRGRAKMLGDMELHTPLTAGVYYGLVTPENVGRYDHGAQRTARVAEITAAEPYSWPDPLPPPMPPPGPPPPQVDAVPPLLSITAPKKNTKIKPRSTVTIKASAIDNVQVVRVEFSAGTKICSVVNKPFNCPWKVPTNSKGPMTLRVEAFDAQGNRTSKTVEVKITGN
jgi:hypothetical protein